MMAEMYGKATGACKGKGGAMHIADVDKGMLGANGIVGAGGPLACGSGLMAKTLGTDQVTVCFFGDGAAEQGTMHEAMNLACCWNLPVVFVCENNGYAESTPWRWTAPIFSPFTRPLKRPSVGRAGVKALPSWSVAASATMAILKATPCSM
jgi:pyruvate dehydrogenase E1 component alpha subunit